MEKDDEVKGYGNSLDFGARIYDTRLGRWLSVDPLQKKFPDFSPYNYAINNPVIFIDYDGRDIVIGTKDPVYRAEVLKHLQSLTNDKLIMEANGKIRIESHGTQNPGNDFKNGTKLIQDLATDTRNEVNIQKTLTPNDGNKTVAIDQSGASNPDVGSDSYILYNPQATGENIINEDGSAGRPAQIGLAHELIHGKKNANGKNDQTKRPDVVDPDGGYNLPGAKKDDIMPQVEIDTRIEENEIRKEQNVTPRAIPKPPNK